MESNEKFATYKEFGKMLREVADLCAKLGDTPLYDSAPDLKEKVFYVVNRGAYDAYIDGDLLPPTDTFDDPRL